MDRWFNGCIGNLLIEIYIDRWSVDKNKADTGIDYLRVPSSIYLFIHQHLFLYLSIYLSVYLSTSHIYLSINIYLQTDYLSIFPSTFSLYLFIYLPTGQQSIFQSIAYQSIFIFINRSSIYSWFHIKGTWIVHSFIGDYLSMPEGTGSCWYLFQ